MFITKAYSAQSETSPLAPFSFQRRDPRPQDVQIEILYCGVCHSDLHQVRNEWHNTTYPCVPGEIIGRLVKVGSEVKKFKSGDIAAVGCLVDSCRECHAARKALSSIAKMDRSSPTTAKTSTREGSPLADIQRASWSMKRLRCGFQPI